MKNKLIICILAGMSIFFSCNRGDSLGESQLDTKDPTNISELDQYLNKTFLDPYNIAVYYEWNQNRVDNNRFLVPPQIENVEPVMDMIKTILIDSYSEVAGEDFFKIFAPREFLLVGNRNFNQSGSINLGVAEGGTRIVLFEIDLVDPNDVASINRFMATSQHEYNHILNNAKILPKELYENITGGYTAQWFNTPDAAARELGFISSYARFAYFEDFTEMVTALLTNTNEGYNKLVNDIKSEEAKRAIREKERLVAEYFENSWDIDIYELQEVVAKNTQKYLNR